MKGFWRNERFWVAVCIALAIAVVVIDKKQKAVRKAVSVEVAE